MTGQLWWQRGVIYQVYPRSFQDSDGDGVGDLRGITARLDYLQWLGVDAVWISPIYPSPMADFGYDVSDYTDIHPLFGTLEDFDELLREAHARDLRVILDLVPNHTSDQHPWFQESRSSRDNSKRDWYIWRDPAPDGGPPNNWLSAFGGCGWKWDEHTRQFFYHAFLEEQPDLNWRNAEVAKAIFDVMRFWLDRGVDGFRVDVLWHLLKDERLRYNPINPDYDPDQDPEYQSLVPAFSADQPEVHDVAAQMREVSDEYPERVLIGEIYLPIGRLVTYYGSGKSEFHLPFNFQLVTQPWKARHIDAAIAEYEGALPEGAWPNWVLGNHDKSRIASRVGAAQARVAAMLLFALRGTPTLYYGDELGMQDVEIPPDRVQDPRAHDDPEASRDPQRTPMQWDDSPGAGFTSGEPWLPIGDDHAEVNVAREREDPGSMLTLHRKLIALRRAEPALHAGAFVPVIGEQGDTLAFIREDGGRTFLVVLNLGSNPALFRPDRWPIHGRIALGTHGDREGKEVREAIELRADEGVVIELTDPEAG